MGHGLSPARAALRSPHSGGKPVAHPAQRGPTTTRRYPVRGNDDAGPGSHSENALAQYRPDRCAIESLLVGIPDPCLADGGPQLETLRCVDREPQADGILQDYDLIFL